MKFPKFLSSLSFRINIILILILVLLGWGFTKMVNYVVVSITNTSRCMTMSNIVCGNIENELLKVESVVKAGALSSKSRKMTPENSRATCDSIRSMANVDSVYVASHTAYSKEVTQGIAIARTTGASVWCEPHVDNVGLLTEGNLKKSQKKVNPKITFVTPLRNSYDVIYAVLCADVNLEWLKALADKEGAGDNSELKVISDNGKYIFHNDAKKIMTQAEDDDLSEEGYDPSKKESTEDESEEGVSVDFEKKNSADGGKKGNVSATINASFPDKSKMNEEELDSARTKVHDDIDNIFLGASINDTLTKVRKTIDRTGWNVICSVPMDDKSYVSIIVQALAFILLFLFLLVMMIAIVVVIGWQLKPLRKISDAMEEVARGNFRARLPKVKGHTEVRYLHDSFEKMQLELERYITDLQTTTESKAAMERDLQIASLIQVGMTPRELPTFPEGDTFDICGMLIPAKQVGGDIYDYFLRDDKLFFIIGDVAGKGVPAALFMTVVGHLFRNVARHVTDPSKIVSAINVELDDRNDQNMFCTLFVGVVDLKTRLLHYCNAGHNAPVFIHEGEAKYLSPEVNLPAGAFGDFVYKPQQMQLQGGDAIFFYSDGVTEAENHDKQLFGEKRLLEVFADRAGDNSAKGLSDKVLASVRKFVNGAEQSDDLTILCVKA